MNMNIDINKLIDIAVQYKKDAPPIPEWFVGNVDDKDEHLKRMDWENTYTRTQLVGILDMVVGLVEGDNGA